MCRKRGSIFRANRTDGSVGSRIFSEAGFSHEFPTIVSFCKRILNSDPILTSYRLHFIDERKLVGGASEPYGDPPAPLCKVPHHENAI